MASKAKPRARPATKARSASARSAKATSARAKPVKARSARAKPAPKARTRSTPLQKGKAGVVLLSGGNPQIAKGDGDAPVQAYIAAMPGWKRAVGKRLDALVTRVVPGVQKGVRWNSPFYGVEGKGYFLSFHVFTHYLKVTFFAGTSLRPVPPGGTEKSKEVRWVDLREDDDVDEAQWVAWLTQAAALPGWIP